MKICKVLTLEFRCFCFGECVVDDDMHLALAHQNYKSGKFKQALEHCSVIYEKYPQRTDILLLLGAVYYQVCVFFLSLLHMLFNICHLILHFSYMSCCFSTSRLPYSSSSQPDIRFCVNFSAAWLWYVYCKEWGGSCYWPAFPRMLW